MRSVSYNVINASFYDILNTSYHLHSSADLPGVRARCDAVNWPTETMEHQPNVVVQKTLSNHELQHGEHRSNYGQK